MMSHCKNNFNDALFPKHWKVLAFVISFSLMGAKSAHLVWANSLGFHDPTLSSGKRVINIFWNWIRILPLSRIWFSLGPSSPFYDSSLRIWFSPNQILMRRRILIQFQKLLTILKLFSSHEILYHHFGNINRSTSRLEIQILMRKKFLIQKEKLLITIYNLTT